MRRRRHGFVAEGRGEIIEHRLARLDAPALSAAPLARATLGDADDAIDVEVPVRVTTDVRDRTMTLDGVEADRVLGRVDRTALSDQHRHAPQRLLLAGQAHA